MEISRFIVYNTNLTSKSKSGFTCNILWHRSCPISVRFIYCNSFSTKTYLYIVQRSVIITRTIGYPNLAGTYMRQRKPRCITYSACNAMAHTVSIVFPFDSCNGMHSGSVKVDFYPASTAIIHTCNSRIYMPFYFGIAINRIYTKYSSATIWFQLFDIHRG